MSDPAINPVFGSTFGKRDIEFRPDNAATWTIDFMRGMGFLPNDRETGFLDIQLDRVDMCSGLARGNAAEVACHPVTHEAGDAAAPYLELGTGKPVCSERQGDINPGGHGEEAGGTEEFGYGRSSSF